MSSSRSFATWVRYVRVLAREFRWTFALLACAVTFATVLTMVTPHRQLEGALPSLGVALFSSWMALFAQPILSPPETWYLAIVFALYPLVGFGLIGEGLFRLGLLLNARRHNEREWMRVKASTARDHIVLCGLGTLGYRILEQLQKSGEEVVAIEIDGKARFVTIAMNAGTTVLVSDAKDEAALTEAGIATARAIVIATSDDLANIEIALDARRLNPNVKIVMRQFDQQIAAKIKEAKIADVAFSSTALAAPRVAEMSLELAGPKR